jgi:hypothetical protein
MTVFFGYGADGSPAGVRESSFAICFGAGINLQNFIMPNKVSQLGDIAPQFTNNRECFVSKSYAGII